MGKWLVESRAGVIMGVYTGESPEEAVNALNNESGGDSSVGDWIVSRIAREETLSDGNILLTAENGITLLSWAPGSDHWLPFRSRDEAIQLWKDWQQGAKK